MAQMYNNISFQQTLSCVFNSKDSLSVYGLENFK